MSTGIVDLRCPLFCVYNGVQGRCGGMCINCEHSVSPSCSSGDDMDDAPPVAQVAPADANDEASSATRRAAASVAVSG